MRRQVGWYDPQSCTFFNGDKDDGCHGAYSEPVFVSDEDETPKDETVELWWETQVQVLENQVAMLLAMLKIRSEGVTSVDMRQNLVNARRRSIGLLERMRR